MAILDRNSGVFTSTTAVTVSRSTGSYGTGTVIVLALFGNTTFPSLVASGWTARHNSVVNLGLYAVDRAGAGESSFNVTAGATGSGEWHCWELSASSTYLSGNAAQSTVGGTTVTTGTLTPTAGDRHLLAVGGGTAATTARSVTGVSDSFVNLVSSQATAQDWPFSGRADRDVTADGVTGYSTVATFSGASNNVEGSIILNYVNAAGGDVTAPTVPASLATTAIGSTTADFSWSASTDAVGVTGYELIVVGP